jgi:hypothetical protein
MVTLELDGTGRGPRLRAQLKEMGYLLGDDYVYDIPFNNVIKITARPGREEVEMLAELMWTAI